MSDRVLVIGDSMSLAHAVRAMVVARRLIAEGADVVYATGPAHQELARREGFEPREVYCVDPAYAIAQVRKGSHIFSMKTLAKYVESDIELINHVKPDLIVNDFRMSLNVSAQQLGVEYWSIMNAYATHHYSAPQHPPRTLPAVRLLGERISRAVFPLLKTMTIRFYAANFRKMRRRLGLDPVSDIFDVIASPHRNLIADLPAFHPCRAAETFEYVGPLIWEPDVAPPDWLDGLEPGEPTVYVSMGSTGGKGDFAKVLTTLRDAGYRVLTTVGGHGEAPDGVYGTELARGSDLLRCADVLVCHGGSGTIYQSISCGVPVVALPTFHDQEINAHRLAATGWGVGLEPVRWKPDDLLEAVERARGATMQDAAEAGRLAIQRCVAEHTSRRLLS